MKKSRRRNVEVAGSKPVSGIFEQMPKKLKTIFQINLLNQLLRGLSLNTRTEDKKAVYRSECPIFDFFLLAGDALLFLGITFLNRLMTFFTAVSLFFTVYRNFISPIASQ
ncbi:MAG: hypothetical protein DRO96_01330 [Candidatus Aenigmatarchaeota archaeon]|nr:MAG: hypothetical protein DRO96_01330 [Candidatus Aenigmarchaeota archaeon]